MHPPIFLIIAVWSTLQVVNSLWGYNSMYTAMHFLCTCIPQSLAEHNSDWCHGYSCQMSHGGVQAFAPLSWWLWGVVLGKSCRRSTIVRERNENQLGFCFCQWVKSAAQDILSYCNNKSRSLSFNFHLLGLGSLKFSTLTLLMNLLWTEPKKLETCRAQLLSKWFWAQTHSHRKSHENNISRGKKQDIFQLPFRL